MREKDNDLLIYRTFLLQYSKKKIKWCDKIAKNWRKTTTFYPYLKKSTWSNKKTNWGRREKWKPKKDCTDVPTKSRYKNESNILPTKMWFPAISKMVYEIKNLKKNYLWENCLSQLAQASDISFHFDQRHEPKTKSEKGEIK